MIQKFNKSENLAFKEISKEDREKRGILGTLFGPIASIVKATRNGRKYDESLWEKVFDNTIVKEMLANGGIPGELDHPADRTETDSSKIAIMMPEAPKKDDAGHLIAYFDIVDTPCGKIAYQLAKYGFKFGVSSRGSGDTYVNASGEEIVDEDTYDFNAFDLVLLPACEDARLQLMTESLNANERNFKKALKEELEAASVEDRAVMQETLTNLDIHIADDSADIVVNNDMNNEEINVESESEVISEDDADKDTFEVEITNTLSDVFEVQADNEESAKAEVEKAYGDGEITLEQTPETAEITVVAKEENSADDIDVNQESDSAEDIGDDMLADLQEALKAKVSLESEVSSLQEKLSVCYAKEIRYEEDINNFKSKIEILSESVNNARSFQVQLKKLEEKLSEKSDEISAKNLEIISIKSEFDAQSNRGKSLEESMSKKDTEIQALKNQLNAALNDNKNLKEKLQESKTNYENEKHNLEENLQDAKKDLVLKQSEYSTKLSKQNELVEKYRNIAKGAVSKYIQLQATRLGVNPAEIRNKLNENYSFNDIDRVCEDLRAYKVNLNSLPFNIQERKNIKMNITESVKPGAIKAPTSSIDDDIDDQLLNVAQMDR